MGERPIDTNLNAIRIVLDKVYKTKRKKYKVNPDYNEGYLGAAIEILGELGMPEKAINKMVQELGKK